MSAAQKMMMAQALMRMQQGSPQAPVQQMQLQHGQNT
jgi:hypothetical protein